MAKRRRKRKKYELQSLSRRERQLLDVVYRLKEATARQVLEQLPDPPSYSAVRSALALLERKGHLEHRQQGKTYFYSPVVSPANARISALRHLVQTFFEGSTTETVAALLGQQSHRLTEDDFERLEQLIENARSRGR